MLTNSNFGRAKTRVVDSLTGKIVKESGWSKNMIFDSGLNRLAGGVGFANIFSFCQVGSSNAANSIQSGAVTFTQAGNTITASGSFFTSAMTGAILKYGTGSAGQEQYITFVNSTTATSTISFTQSSPIAGTVWLVQQTALTAFLFSSNSYQTTGGSNTTTFTGNQISLQRTFIFPVQGSTYNVNEIGYSNATGGAACSGRIVLPSTDTVTPTQFYVVVLQMTFTVSPGSPSSVGNVGTNINTAGTSMIDYWDCQIINSDGSTGQQQGVSAGGTVDGGNAANISAGMYAAAATQNSSPSTSAYPNVNYSIILGTFPTISNTGQPVGVGVSTITFSGTTTGQTINCIRFGRLNTPGIEAAFSQNLTASFTAPNGAFSGNLQLQITFTRTLTN